VLGSSWVAAQLAASQKGLSSMNEWISEWVPATFLYAFLTSPCMTHALPSYPPWFVHVNNILWSFSLWNCLHPRFTSSRLHPHTTYSSALSSSRSLRARSFMSIQNKTETYTQDGNVTLLILLLAHWSKNCVGEYNKLLRSRYYIMRRKNIKII
jgi:hypothetical protein